MNYRNAVKGIKKLFLAEALGIIAAIAEIASLLYLAVNKYNINDPGSVIRENLQASGLLVPFLVFSIGGIILLLVSWLLTLAGLVNGSHDEGNFRRALWAELALIAVTIVSGLFRNSNPDIDKWLKILSTVGHLAVTLLVLAGITRISENFGRQDLVSLCESSQKWLIRTFAITALFELTLVLFFLNDAVMALVFTLVAFVLEIVAYVVYIRVLAKARSLG